MRVEEKGAITEETRIEREDCCHHKLLHQDLNRPNLFSAVCYVFCCAFSYHHTIFTRILVNISPRHNLYRSHVENPVMNTRKSLCYEAGVSPCIAVGSRAASGAVHLAHGKREVEQNQGPHAGPA